MSDSVHRARLTYHTFGGGPPYDQPCSECGLPLEVIQHVSTEPAWRPTPMRPQEFHVGRDWGHRTIREAPRSPNGGGWGDRDVSVDWRLDALAFALLGVLAIVAALIFWVAA